jgi:hypothetical protein
MTRRRNEDEKGGLTPIGDTRLMREMEKKARQQLKAPTPAQQRVIEAASVADDDATLAILYQHSALCQTFLPYRDPGDDARSWERVNGNVHLEVLAGKALHPVKEAFTPVGLPFGPKARLVLMHINQQALFAQSPEIEVQDSLTSFVRRSLNLDTGGRTIRTVKDQLSRLSAASIRLGIVKDGRARTVNSQIVSAFDIWFPKDERQRVFWPSMVRLSLDYWESLKAHAVPLAEAHIAALSHSGMALDIYAWLAQRLHRVPTGKPALISWPLLQVQFGQDYARLDQFRDRGFKPALKQVLALYKDAKVDVDGRGLMLHQSKPAVLPRIQMIVNNPVET